MKTSKMFIDTHCRIYFLLLFISNTHAILSRNPIDLLCQRVYFTHNDIDTFPWAPMLDAVYVRTKINIDNFPVYQQERGGLYFQYDKENNVFYFSPEIGNIKTAFIKTPAFDYFMKSPYVWADNLKDNIKNPFGGVMRTSYGEYILSNYPTIKWKKYYWSLKPLCVKFSQCETGELAFINDKNASNPIVTDKFKIVPDQYQENRPVYISTLNSFRKNHLYYKRGLWLISWIKFSTYASYKVSSNALRPEYITGSWSNTDSSNWKEIPTKLICLGKTPCTTNPCRNGGTCNVNYPNYSFCVCKLGYSGRLCQIQSLTCPKKVEPNFNNEIGAIATEFCGPNYNVYMCRPNGTNKVKWMGKPCLFVAPTKPAPTNAPYSALPDNFWIYFISIGSVLMLFIPLFHRCCCSCNISCDRIYSIHWYIGLLLWLIFIMLYFVLSLTDYGYLNFRNILYCGIAFASLFYLYMLIETLCSNEFDYVTELEEGDDIKGFINRIVANRPIIKIDGESFHYETKTRFVHYTDYEGNSQTRTETYQEKVTTWTGTEYFTFGSCTDTSNLEEVYLLDKITRVRRIKFYQQIDYSDDETKEAFEKFKTNFCEVHKRLDVYFDSTVSEEIPEFKERVMAYGKDHGKPCWMNGGLFCLFSCFLLTWPYRVFLKKRTDKQEFTIVKEISVKTMALEISPSQENTQLYPPAITNSSNEKMIPLQQFVPQNQQGFPQYQPQYQQAPPYLQSASNPLYSQYGQPNIGAEQVYVNPPAPNNQVAPYPPAASNLQYGQPNSSTQMQLCAAAPQYQPSPPVFYKTGETNSSQPNEEHLKISTLPEMHFEQPNSEEQPIHAPPTYEDAMFNS